MVSARSVAGHHVCDTNIAKLCNANAIQDILNHTVGPMQVIPIPMADLNTPIISK